MIDLITGLGGQVIGFVIAAAGGLIGLWVYGWKKKREGAAQERERAIKAREAAAKEARDVRKGAANESTDKQREEVSKWEK